MLQQQHKDKLKKLRKWKDYNIIWGNVKNGENEETKKKCRGGGGVIENM